MRRRILGGGAVLFGGVSVLLAVALGVGLQSVSPRTPVIAVASPLMLLCSVWLMQRAVAVLNLRSLSIPGFWYLVYLAVIVIPAFFVYAEQRDPYRLRYLFAVLGASIVVPFGVLSVKGLLKFRESEAKAFHNSALQDSPSESRMSAFILLLAVAWGLTLAYVWEVREIPLFYMLSHPGEYSTLVQLREESLKLLDSPLRYAYFLLRSTLYPFLILVSFGRCLQTRQRQWAVLFVASFVSGIAFAGFTIAKSPVASILLLLCLFYFLYRRGRLGLAFLLAGALLFLAFPIFVVLTEYSGSIDLVTALRSVGLRMFVTPSTVLYYYFEVFPDVVPYQYGRTIGKFALLIGDRPFESGNFVGLYMAPRAMGSVNANAAFLGNLNADFGMVGVLAGSFLAGGLMELAQVYLVRRGKSSLTLAIYSFLAFDFALLSSSPLPIILMTNGALLIVPLALSFVLLNSMLSGSTRTKPYPAGRRGPAKRGTEPQVRWTRSARDAGRESP